MVKCKGCDKDEKILFTWRKNRKKYCKRCHDEITSK